MKWKGKIMFLLIKTSLEKIKECGSLYEAGRGHWYISLARALGCTHAIIVIKGTREIKAVYKIDKWNHSFYKRYNFEGHVDTALENKLLGKTLNDRFFIKGRRNPIAYTAESELLAA